MNSPNASTAALLTPSGRGAVATVCYRGDCNLLDVGSSSDASPLFAAANGKPLAQQPLGRICFGHWGRDIAEEVVLCRIDANTVEIHCHGGPAAVRRILDDLRAAGCTVQTWQQMTAETTSTFDAECLDALTRATTERTAKLLLQQTNGLLRQAFEQLAGNSEQWAEGSGQQKAIPVASSVLPDAFPPHSPLATRHSPLPTAHCSLPTQIATLLHWANFGLHLTQPWNVVLAGRPNVGKSSLINALVGYSRSIVFDQPGTTRDVVTAETAIDGWPVRLADTAGLRDDADKLESAGIASARTRLRDADCRLVLLDISCPPHADDHRLLADWPDEIVIAHKCDLNDAWGDARPAAALPVSSKTGEGIEPLLHAIAARLVPELPPPGTPIPITPRQVQLLQRAQRAIEKNTLDKAQSAIANLLR